MENLQTTTSETRSKSVIIIIIIINITSIALKSSGAQARKRNKTKSLIIFKSRGHIGVIISLRGRRLFNPHDSLDINTCKFLTFQRAMKK